MNYEKYDALASGVIDNANIHSQTGHFKKIG
jgi:hypothetical protein